VGRPSADEPTVPSGSAKRRALAAGRTAVDDFDIAGVPSFEDARRRDIGLS
jgi:hypothetical protein